MPAMLVGEDENVHEDNSNQDIFTENKNWIVGSLPTEPGANWNKKGLLHKMPANLGVLTRPHKIFLLHLSFFPFDFSFQKIHFVITNLFEVDYLKRTKTGTLNVFILDHLPFKIVQKKRMFLR